MTVTNKPQLTPVYKIVDPDGLEETREQKIIKYSCYLFYFIIAFVVAYIGIDLFIRGSCKV